MREHAPHAFAVASSEPLTSSGGPRFSGQQLLTKLSCSAIFFTCAGAAYVSTWCAAPPPPPPPSPLGVTPLAGAASAKGQTLTAK